jgi:predicted ribosome quality control (RQC) complex YloA/Tae2 family protein
MSFDALTLSAVRDELEPSIAHTRIQKMVFIDELALALELFGPDVGRTNVLLSADLDQGRVQRLTHLPTRGLERDTPFSLVARKHLRNAHIRSIRQPRLERVLELDCEQRDSSGRPYRVTLIVEAMGRRSNLVLVDDDGTIVDAARRTPPSRNARRPILPHLTYAPPPPQARLYPEQVSVATLAAGAAEASGTVARYVSDRLAGLSPLAGREIAFRGTGAVDTPIASADWSLVVAAAFELQALVDSHRWQPSVTLDPDHPLAYAPYELRHLAATGATLQMMPTISAAMDAYYSQLAVAGPARRGDALAAERRALLAPLERATESTVRRIAALQHQLTSGHEQREPLRLAGELIVSHLSEIEPGASELVLDDERVVLDPTLSAVANSQAYFARYRKAREAEERVPELLQAARQRSEYLADLRALVEVADGMDSIRALRREVGAVTGSAAPVERRPRGDGRRQPVRAQSGPYRRVSVGDNWEALVGASAAGNVAVTFDLGQADDLWLHARGTPGAHVILRTAGAEPPDAVIERAAQVAAYHSARRADTAVDVDVAQRRYVKKIAGGPPGLVRYSNERTIRVTPRP